MWREKKIDENTEIGQAPIHLDTIQIGFWRRTLDYGSVWGKEPQMTEQARETLRKEALIAIEVIKRELMKGKKISRELETSLSWSKQALEREYGTCELP